MADAFSIQSEDPKMLGIPFEDRVAMLVDAEYTSRKSNRLKRLIHGAGFEQPDAHIADVNYTSGRKLNRELIQRLASCEYTWHVHLEWRHASSITKRTSSAFQIFSWSSTQPVKMEII